MTTTSLKPWLSVIAFGCSIIVGFIALFLPPTGMIDNSVLWFIAQLLCFTAGILGINFNIDSLSQKASAAKPHETPRYDNHESLEEYTDNTN